MNEVQLEDKAVEVKVYDTIEELQKAIETNETLANDFIQNEDDFLKKHLKSVNDDNVADDKGTTEKKADAKESRQDEEVVIENLRIKADLLGTYNKNTENYGEAIEKALKGKKEADKTIETLKANYENAAQQNQELASRLTALEKKPEVKEEKKTVVPEINFPDISDLDLITEEGQAKAKELFSAMATANKDLHKAFHEKMAEVDRKIAEADRRGASRDEAVRVSQQVSNEFSELDKLVSRHDDVFKVERSVQEIETDYLECLKELGKLKGYTESMFDKDGRIIDKYMALLGEYQDDKSDMRRTAEAAKVGLPEDFNALNMVYNIRVIKNQHPTLSYDEAFDLYKLRHPDEFTKEKKTESDLEDRIARGAEKRKTEHAAEAPVKSGDNLSDVSKVSAKTIEQILLKMPVDRNKEEKELVRAYFIANGVPDEEATAINT